MKKSLEISAKLDMADFDKSIDAMQRKLRELYAPSDLIRAQTQTSARLQQAGMGGLMSTPSPEATQRTSMQSRRELESYIREQAQGQEKLTKIIVARSEKLEDLKKKQQELTRGSREELEIKEKIARVEENNFRLRENYKQRDSVLNQALDAKERASGRGVPDVARGRGGRGGDSGGPRMPAFGGFGGAGAAAMAGLALPGAIGAMAEQYTGYGMRLESAKGSAVQGTAGRDLEAIYGGRSPFEAAWMPERTEAAGLAAQKAGRNRWTDRLKGIGSVGAIAGGIGVGAAALLGTPFTMGGSALGLPAAGAMIAGGAYGLSNDRSRQGILGGKEYNQLLAGQQAKDFRETLANLKEQDPGKKLALEQFETNYRRNVTSQRTLGLSNKGFYGEGGFLQRSNAAGFMPEQTIGMAQNIVGAGGSARMGKNAEFGLQMERSGLTNAGGILGSLSGSIQSPEASKRATIGIISEAFKIGLDNTDFAEENRKFSQAAAAIIGRTGVTSEADQDRLVSALGQFLGERTNRGVEAAGNAYERFQERGSQLGGRRGAMRFMAARQDANLGRIGTQELVELLGMRPEDIREDSAAVRSFAKMAGFEGSGAVGQLQDTLKNINKQSRFLIPSNRQRVDTQQGIVEKYMQDKGLGYNDLVEQSRKGQLPPDVDMAFGKMQIGGNIEERGGLIPAEAEARIGEFLGGQPLPNTAYKGLAASTLENKTGRVEDTAITAAAEGANEARKNFVELLPALQDLGKASHELVNQLAPAATALRDTAAASQAQQPKGNPYASDVYGPVLQPQANKPKGN